MTAEQLCLKSQKSLLDRVSTGSGSDLVRDQHAIFLMIFNSYGLTRSLPLPVLTRSKRHPDFWGKALDRIVVPYFEISSSTDYAEVLTICVICG